MNQKLNFEHKSRINIHNKKLTLEENKKPIAILEKKVGRGRKLRNDRISRKNVRKKSGVIVCVEQREIHRDVAINKCLELDNRNKERSIPSVCNMQDHREK